MELGLEPGCVWTVSCSHHSVSSIQRQGPLALVPGWETQNFLQAPLQSPADLCFLSAP